MEALATLLDHIKKQGLATGNVLGFFHVLIGRHMQRGRTAKSSPPACPRAKLYELAQEGPLGHQPGHRAEYEAEELPPKDRQRFWYGAIAKAGVDSAAAAKAGDLFGRKLEALGYQVSRRERSDLHYDQSKRATFLCSISEIPRSVVQSLYLTRSTCRPKISTI